MESSKHHTLQVSNKVTTRSFPTNFAMNHFHINRFIFTPVLSIQLTSKIPHFCDTLQFHTPSVFTFVVEWHCECNIRLYFEEESIQYSNKEHTLCICNHQGEVDWQLGYTLLERLDGLKVIYRMSHCHYM